MLTKAQVIQAKTESNQAVQSLVRSLNSEKNILFVLNNLGRLPKDFDDSWLQELLKSNNDHIRLSAIKNIGKTYNILYLEKLYQIATNDSSTLI